MSNWDTLKDYIQKRIKTNQQISMWDGVNEDNCILTKMIEIEKRETKCDQMMKNWVNRRS